MGGDATFTCNRFVAKLRDVRVTVCLCEVSAAAWQGLPAHALENGITNQFAGM